MKSLFAAHPDLSDNDYILQTMKENRQEIDAFDPTRHPRSKQEEQEDRNFLRAQNRYMYELTEIGSKLMQFDPDFHGKSPKESIQAIYPDMIWHHEWRERNRISAEKDISKYKSTLANYRYDEKHDFGGFLTFATGAGGGAIAGGLLTEHIVGAVIGAVAGYIFTASAYTWITDHNRKPKIEKTKNKLQIAESWQEEYVFNQPDPYPGMVYAIKAMKENASAYLIYKDAPEQAEILIERMINQNSIQPA